MCLLCNHNRVKTIDVKNEKAKKKKKKKKAKNTRVYDNENLLKGL